MQQETDSSAKSSAAAIRIRENQRRSRARRKEYVEGMQRKLQDFETKGVAATLEMQQAAREVAIENSRLRLLLAHSGVGVDAVEGFLQSFKGLDQDDASEAEHYAAKIATAESIAALGRSSTVATLFPEHAHVDKLAVLASASMQQSASGHDSDGTITSDDSTGPVTPSSSNLNAPSPRDVDFEAPQTMSCDAAAHIIAQMQGCGFREPSKGALENNGQNDYLIQNSAFLKILEAASIFN
ncbi:hypothetical protein V8C35DRAFT_45419 [Trichoderma chlorosporum]